VLLSLGRNDGKKLMPNFMQGPCLTLTEGGADIPLKGNGCVISAWVSY